MGGGGGGLRADRCQSQDLATGAGVVHHGCHIENRDASRHRPATADAAAASPRRRLSAHDATIAGGGGGEGNDSGLGGGRAKGAFRVRPGGWGLEGRWDMFGSNSGDAVVQSVSWSGPGL